MTRIHQVLSGAGPVDAVTSQAFAYADAFRSWGMDGGVYAGAIEPAVRSRVEPVARLRPAADDLLLFHYSAYAPRLEPLLDWPQRKLLVYHNVTPAEWLWEHQPHVATLCALGREHLPRWARAVDVAVAVSEFNAAELRAAGAREVRVVPIVFDPRRLRPGSGGSVISVGRLVPHKRPELVLRVAGLAGVGMDVVGEALSPAYGSALRAAAPPGVTLHGRIEQAALDGLWRDAGVFLTLSEHEGFCVPLLEAFASDTVVVARPVGGMVEVGGDAVLWVEDRDLAVVSELVLLALRDEELRAECIARGRERLAEYAPDRVLDALRSAVDSARD